MLEPGLQTMDQTATLLEIWRIMLNELARESISESNCGSRRHRQIVVGAFPALPGTLRTLPTTSTPQSIDCVRLRV